MSSSLGHPRFWFLVAGTSVYVSDSRTLDNKKVRKHSVKSAAFMIALVNGWAPEPPIRKLMHTGTLSMRLTAAREPEGDTVRCASASA